MTNILPLMVLRGLGCDAWGGLQPFLFLVSASLGLRHVLIQLRSPDSPRINMGNIKDIERRHFEMIGDRITKRLVDYS